MSSWREIRRQIDEGVFENELCIPCKNALADSDLARIGTPAWVNDGLPKDEVENGKPLLYCTLCKHIIRAKEFARRNGRASQVPNARLEWDFDAMNEGIFIHEDNADLDGADGDALQGFPVERCNFTKTIRHQWVDFEIIKRWISDCEGVHGGVCSSHHYKPRGEAASILLIDVQQGCLIRATSELRYFALSYVWGDAKQFLCLKKNFDWLLQPGSLSQCPITQTIKDAFTLVAELEERYLWVDTVCIVQDDPADKMIQINQMATIYNRAIATIIAMSGHSASSGLPGVHPTPRHTSSAVIAPGLRIVQRASLAYAINEYNYGTQEYIYSTRAWTYQERLLSRRCIIFLKEQLFFRCSTHTISEDRYEPDIGDSAGLNSLDGARAWSHTNFSQDARHPSNPEFFRVYEDQIVEYTSKNMGIPADILNAFNGIQTALAEIFGFTFMQGIPIELFHLALLWTPVAAMQRRISDVAFPSWSWAGWVGRVRYNDLITPANISTQRLVDNFETLAVFEPLQKQNPSTELRCRGEIVSLTNFDLKKCKERLNSTYYSALVTSDIYTIHSAHDTQQRCGIIYGSIPPEPTSLSLIQLSRLRRANSMTRFGPMISFWNDGSVREEALHHERFTDGEWCTSTVLLVHKLDNDRFERVGIGQVHSQAWKEAAPQKKTFWLV
ncbi:heterokaryon incompatibility protein-domain-containing protein [Lophiotrema nucula]|uniref:Heterokaryon incompatibility protein-domain-containing protein n=1 Tax=Lophiotrema nucula TaxID=690887 RepID=A0A6A5YW85_9PLEO|nr:heterokaryon incompatibility protein-domain-containing protein [Lophiotrema nucula]